MTERITLGGLPTRDVLEMIEHLDDVIRELAVIAIGASTGTAKATVPEQVLATMERVRPVLYPPKESISRQVARAWHDGVATVDVQVELPLSAAVSIRQLLEVFETLDACAIEDESMLLPASSRVLAEFRHWFFTRLADELQSKSLAVPEDAT